MSNIMEDKKSSISNIIDALTKIENNHLNSNRNNAIYSMLKEIGLYTKALYVSIYELVDSSAFELTHQWRLFNNTESPNHDLILPTDGVPCIFNILYQGESIILDDIGFYAYRIQFFLEIITLLLLLYFQLFSEKD